VHEAVDGGERHRWIGEDLSYRRKEAIVENVVQEDIG